MNAKFEALFRAAATATAMVMLGACSRTTAVQHAAVPSAPPQWNGTWLAGGTEMSLDGYTPVDPKTMAGPPPDVFIFSSGTAWNDSMRKKVREIAAVTHGDWDIAQPTGAGGWGYPLMMIGPAPLQFVNSPGVTLILNQYRDLREIYTDGRGHQPVEEGWPATTWGDSVGHWEADTLVIDTIGVRDPQVYFGITAPFSENAHYVERLRLTAPDRIEGAMTVEDPDTLSRPIQLKLLFVRSKQLERMVIDSFSNNRTGFDGKTTTIEAAKK